MLCAEDGLIVGAGEALFDRIASTFLIAVSLSLSGPCLSFFRPPIARTLVGEVSFRFPKSLWERLMFFCFYCLFSLRAFFRCLPLSPLLSALCEPPLEPPQTFPPSPLTASSSNNNKRQHQQAATSARKQGYLTPSYLFLFVSCLALLVCTLLAFDVSVSGTPSHRDCRGSSMQRLHRGPSCQPIDTVSRTSPFI